MQNTEEKCSKRRYSNIFTRVEEALYSGIFALLLLAFVYGAGSIAASKVLSACTIYSTFYYVAAGAIIPELLKALRKQK